jgi:S-adenosylmethionine hydrolase
MLTQAVYFLPQVSTTFHGRDLFGPVAAHLARGVEPAQFGPPLTDLVRLPYARPQRTGETVVGEVTYLDHYGNIVTNIPSEMLTDLVPGQCLMLTLAERPHTLLFVETYGAEVHEQLVCLINSNNTYEIALPQGNAAARLSVQVGDRVVLTLGPGV